MTDASNPEVALSGSPYRWLAVATYRSENGPVIVEHDIEELEELQDLIEKGPDWNTIEEIRITLSRVLRPGLTIEKTA